MVSLKALAQSLLLLSTATTHVSGANITTPTRIGVVIFPGVEAIDVFGPLDALFLHSLMNYLNLTIIAETMDPVSTDRMPWRTSRAGSTFGAEFVPTHTFANAPPLDVLLVPGGLGTRAPAPRLNSTIQFVKDRYPELQYLLTVCTGAGIAARAGVLDGRNATTSKRAWVETTALGPKVRWQPKARWVIDGNVWSSSGVSAGIDLMIAFIGHVWGADVSKSIANGMEYVAITDSHNDPFAELYNNTAPAVIP
ncbi:ThiJ/PfpI family protein [Halenospora varia]|nr:ThiJ/PfpI family protein [Halenospora varia]